MIDKVEVGEKLAFLRTFGTITEKEASTVLSKTALDGCLFVVVEFVGYCNIRKSLKTFGKLPLTFHKLEFFGHFGFLGVCYIDTHLTYEVTPDTPEVTPETRHRIAKKWEKDHFLVLCQ